LLNFTWGAFITGLIDGAVMIISSNFLSVICLYLINKKIIG